MEIIQNLFVTCLAITLLPQMLNAEENHDRATTKPPFNPLEDLILVHDRRNEPKSEPLARVKRQYDPYNGNRFYPLPIILPIGGFGGFGGGFGRGFGGRGFGGRGFGGFGGRGFGGRGFGGGFGGRGFGGGFGGGRGRG